MRNHPPGNHPRQLKRPGRSAALTLLVWLTATAGAAYGAGPFQPTEFDVVYSNAASVRYDVTRSCLADLNACLGETGLTSPCQPGDSVTGQSCATGIHRFCVAKGHVSGYGVERAGDPSRVDVTCQPAGTAELRPLGSSPCNTTLGAACTVAVDRHCRDVDHKVGFGPVEDGGPDDKTVTCIQKTGTREFPGQNRQAVEALVPGCNFSGMVISTACRQAMDLFCRDQDETLGGGFGPRELDLTAINVGCLQPEQDWVQNPTLPDSPALPIDVIERSIDATGHEYEGTANHNLLMPRRSMSFDGRLHVSMFTITVDEVEIPYLNFRIQAPEIFPQPLSQEPIPGLSQSFDTPHNDRHLYGTSLIHSEFHGSEDGDFDGLSAAICDPHQGSQPFAALNRQQSAPGRVSNPYACGFDGQTITTGGPGPLDHDCYDVTVVSVVDEGTHDEIWGTPVTAVVAYPKHAVPVASNLAERASVVHVEVGMPQMAPLDSTAPDHFLELNVTGDGRLLVAQGDSEIRYSVNADPAVPPCDVDGWATWGYLHEMHSDPGMADYGIAKYPIRDLEGRVLDPSAADPGDYAVRAAYPWIDRDGDNMMFMLGRSTLFYHDPEVGEPVRERFEVIGHPHFGNVSPVPPSCPDPPNPCPQVPLVPPNISQIGTLTDDLPRVGQVFVGLWTQGKMFSFDNRNNSVDFGVPGNPRYHRLLRLYEDVPEGTEVGESIRTLINSPENQFFYDPELRPDTPREVVWTVSSMFQTDEVAFDDAIDPRALIVSPMGATIRAFGDWRGRYQDGFDYVTGVIYHGRGFDRPAHLANQASTLSEAVDAATSVDLSDNVLWNAPPFGYLLGGARAEPIAAGGYRGKGLWLDGVDDRLEYVIPPQPESTTADFENADWFYHLALDPRDLSQSRRLLTSPDGSWLDVVDATTLRIGKGAMSADVVLPAALALEAGKWSTVALASPRLEYYRTPFLIVYVDGYRLDTLPNLAYYFRLEPGRLTLGDETDGFKGWVDDFKVIARWPNPEVICNHARGTLVGVEDGDPLDGLASVYPESSHNDITGRVDPEFQFPRYACERPIADPADIHDQADHSHYACLGQTRRLDTVADEDKCIRPALLFEEGPLLWDLPRPDSTLNPFCLACHVSSHPSDTMKPELALSFDPIPTHQDVRRQPMQHPPKFFANILALLFGDQPPATFQTPVEGVDLDPYVLPSSQDP